MLRPLALASVLAVAACAPADRAAREPAAPAGTPDVAAALRAAEEAWAEALIGPDFERLDALLAPGFVLRGVDATLPGVSRARHLADLREGGLEVAAVAVTELVVESQTSPDSASVDLWLSWRGREGGQDRSERVNVLDRWVRRGSGWQAVERRVLQRMPGE